jgi:hypothetical protein
MTKTRDGLAGQWMALAFFILVAGAMAAQLAFYGPFLTNDGPAHVAFAYRLANEHSTQLPLQAYAYMVDLRLATNAMVYVVIAALMKITSPLAAESIIQWLCLIGPMCAAVAAVRIVERKNVWIALLIFPLTLNETFFLGLYNFSLSLIGFFVSLAIYLSLRKQPTVLKSVALSAALVFTLLCHAGGFIAIAAGIAAMAATAIAIDIRQGTRFVSAVRVQMKVILPLCVPIPLIILAAAHSAGAALAFGPSVAYRIRTAVSLQILNVGGQHVQTLVLLFAILLIALTLWTLVPLIGNRHTPISVDSGLSLALVSALASSIVLVLIFPDTMGGGWTHVRRFMVFPYFWLVTLTATSNTRRNGHSYGAAVLTVVVGTISLGFASVSMERERAVREQSAPWTSVDSVVGSHCTVLPIIIDARPQDPKGAPMELVYAPYAHLSNRLELNRDRIVLYNFLARLKAYPVNFRPAIEPQTNIFHWQPEQRDFTQDTFDIAGFESRSHLEVDYVFIDGDRRMKSASFNALIDDVAKSSTVVYSSPDGNATLYRRHADSMADSQCTGR